MNFDVKLPKSYYKYSDIDIETLDKNESRKANLAISLSSFISCKLEQFALMQRKPVQEVLKWILIEEGVLEEEDLEFSGRNKSSSKFIGVDCNELKDIGTTKLYRIFMSEYAKAKVIKYLLKKEYDASFFFKKSLVKKSGKKEYEILEVSEIGI